jgi:hypothetical protein
MKNTQSLTPHIGIAKEIADTIGATAGKYTVEPIGTPLGLPATHYLVRDTAGARIGVYDSVRRTWVD